ncbi:MAG: RNA polymerase sigma factor [bacterium]|nr:RNA polymerase sigma factor [bacterium]
MSLEEEQLLVEEAQGGSIVAFEKLLELYELPIRRYCRALRGHVEEGDDAAQVTFVRVWKHLPNLREIDSFRAWMFSVARNVCRDAARKGRRRVVTTPLDAADSQIDQHLASAGVSLDDRIAAREKLDAVLAGLTFAEKDILLLRELEDLTYEEIAGQLGSSVDSVKGRLKRLRHKVKHIICSNQD